MDALTLIFTISAIVGTLLVIWSYTKKGKEWLKNL